HRRGGGDRPGRHPQRREGCGDLAGPRPARISPVTGNRPQAIELSGVRLPPAAPATGSIASSAEPTVAERARSLDLREAGTVSRQEVRPVRDAPCAVTDLLRSTPPPPPGRFGHR